MRIQFMLTHAALPVILAALPWLASPALAGANHGAVAYLSWECGRSIATRYDAPVGSFPVYLVIENVQDIAKLGASLRWTPYDSTGGCYDVAPSAGLTGSAYDSLTARTSDVPPGAAFEGDSTYSWTIAFPPGIAVPRCISYQVTCSATDSIVPAQFVLSSLYVLDSAGNVDTLQVLHGAEIASPALLGDVPRCDRVDVQHATSGAAIVLNIAGSHLRPDTRVTLERRGQIVAADSVLALDATRLVATIGSMPVDAVPYDLALTNPGTGGSVSADAVTISPPAPSGASSIPSASPSNDASAYTQVSIRRPSEGTTYIIPNGHLEWPADFNSPSLVRQLETGDSIVISSSLYPLPNQGGVGFQAGYWSWIGWVLPVPVYATDVGLLVTADNACNGSGSWADVGDTLCDITFQCGWGCSYTAPLVIGTDVRNWRGGQLQPQVPFFVDHPSSPHTQELFAGTGTDGLTQVYYDLQHIQLPEAVRKSSITKIVLTQRTVVHDYLLYATAQINGLALWPRHTVQDAAGHTVVPQFQNEAGVGDSLYGGYVDPYTGALVGECSTVFNNGCYETCLAMCMSFFGHPATLKDLNYDLQRRHGFTPTRMCSIDSVGGQEPGNVVRISNMAGPAGAATPWRRFIVDRTGGWWSGAAATLTVVNATHARIDSHPAAGILISVGAEGRVYRDVDDDSLASIVGASDIAWSKYVGGYAVDAVEGAMLADRPPILFVGSATRPHWAVATGWRPEFVSAAAARGTYDLIDPARPMGTMLALYDNRFGAAMVPRRVAGQPQMASHRAETSSASQTGGTLHLKVLGDCALALTDAQGSYLRYNATTDTYSTTFGGVEVKQHANPGCAGDSSLPDVASDIIRMPADVAATYLVALTGGTAGGVTLTCAIDSSGTYVANASAGATLAAGGCGYFQVHVDPASTPHLSVTYLGLAGVTSPGEAPKVLGVRIAPSLGRGGMRVTYDVPTTSPGRLEVFDVAGRRVRTLFSGAMEAGSHTLVWDGRSDGGASLGGGVYFVRLRSPEGTCVARCVLIN